MGIFELYLPQPKWKPGGRGRPPCDLRGIINGMLYLNKTGCQWRMIPKEFGNWSTIYRCFKRWREQNRWAHIMEQLRQTERKTEGRNPEPSAGSMDSQSIKTATQNQDIGYDGNKKVKGRKRHILVDTLGLIIAVVVSDAGTNDRDGLVELLTQYFADGAKRLRKIWVDGAYPAEWLEEWVRGLKQTHKIDLESTTNQAGKGFSSRSLALGGGTDFRWLLNDRRHSRDYQRLTINSAAMIQISMIRLLLNRLA